MNGPVLPPLEKLAYLARLRIEPAEAERLRTQLATVLAHFESLQGIDTEGVEASPYAIETTNVRRPDGPIEGSVALPRGARLVHEHAPERHGDCYQVAPILEG